MLRRLESFRLETQFDVDSEDDDVFDGDDPDFAQDSTKNGSYGIPSDCINVENDSRERLPSSSSSEIFDSDTDDTAFSNSLTIEQIKLYFSYCLSCGVNWRDGHVSLDCLECGGYALCSPCPQCEGSCGEVWHRDFTLSHSLHEAHWKGICNLSSRVYSVPEVVDNTLAKSMSLLSTESSS